MKTKISATYLQAVLAAALAACLSACGGGSSSTAVPAATPALVLAGTAATGAAISTRPVDVKCASGIGTATTKADGSYSISIDNGQLPCMIRVTKADGGFLHGVAPGPGTVSGTTITTSANVTTVTELVVASLAGSDPAAFYTAFSSATATSLTTAKISSAQSAVISTLKAGGVDLSAVGDLLTGTLTPKTSTTAGNAYDQALDLLATTLTASGTSLATLTATVGTSSTQTATGTATTSATASLPADLLLKAAASNCSALRSGRYRVVSFRQATAGSFSTQIVTLNATALTATDIDGNVSTLTANGPCRFLSSTGSDLLVSPSGLAINRALNGSVSVAAILFPEQTIPLADLAGDWNTIGQEQNFSNSALYDLKAVSVTYSATGAFSNITYCNPISTCVVVTGKVINVKANTASGGFDVVSTTDGWTDRMFAYRAGGGELILVSLSGNGSYGISTKSQVSTLTNVGTISNFWNEGVLSNLTGTTVSEGTNTITAHNTVANSLLRASSVGSLSSGVTRPETLSINTPRNGFTRRTPETVTASDGTSSSVVEFISLGLRGMGVSVTAISSSPQMVFSVTKP